MAGAPDPNERTPRSFLSLFDRTLWRQLVGGIMLIIVAGFGALLWHQVTGSGNPGKSSESPSVKPKTATEEAATRDMWLRPPQLLADADKRWENENNDIVPSITTMSVTPVATLNFDGDVAAYTPAELVSMASRYRACPW